MPNRNKSKSPKQTKGKQKVLENLELTIYQYLNASDNETCTKKSKLNCFIENEFFKMVEGKDTIDKIQELQKNVKEMISDISKGYSDTTEIDKIKEVKDMLIALIDNRIRVLEESSKTDSGQTKGEVIHTNKESTIPDNDQAAEDSQNTGTNEQTTDPLTTGTEEPKPEAEPKKDGEGTTDPAETPIDTESGQAKLGTEKPKDNKKSNPEAEPKEAEPKKDGEGTTDPAKTPIDTKSDKAKLGTEKPKDNKKSNPEAEPKKDGEGTTTSNKDQTTSTSATTITNNKAAHINALFVSAVMAVIAGMYTGFLQNMLFGKIFFGSALMFGHAMPAVSLAMASTAFGVVAFVTILAVITLAKYNENRNSPLFPSITKSHYMGYTLKALLVAATGVIATKYAVTIQMAAIGKVLLGGALLTNIGFALIPVVLVAIASHSMNNFKAISTTAACIAGFLFAGPIAQSLLGITIIGAASSIAVALVAGALTLGLISAAEKAINSGWGFETTVYAISFVLLSIYASPLQIALGYSLFVMTPLLSNISFGAIASVATAIVIPVIYNALESIFGKVFIDDSSAMPAKTQTDKTELTVGTGAGKPVTTKELGTYKPQQEQKQQAQKQQELMESLDKHSSAQPPTQTS